MQTITHSQNQILANLRRNRFPLAKDEHVPGTLRGRIEQVDTLVDDGPEVFNQGSQEAATPARLVATGSHLAVSLGGCCLELV